jgi:hypothetical protein
MDSIVSKKPSDVEWVWYWSLAPLEADRRKRSEGEVIAGKKALR